MIAVIFDILRIIASLALIVLIVLSGPEWLIVSLIIFVMVGLFWSLLFRRDW